MKEKIAIILCYIGTSPQASLSFEGKITMGYGKLYPNGDFRFPLPASFIKEEFGTMDIEKAIEKEVN